MRDTNEIAQIINEDIRENNGLVDMPNDGLRKRANYQGDDEIELVISMNVADGWKIDDFNDVFTTIQSTIQSDTAKFAAALNINAKSAVKKLDCVFNKNGGNPIIVGLCNIMVPVEALTPNPQESDDINTSKVFIALSNLGYA